ncbi:MAG: hypothetical protein NT091_02230 [Candidatus Falkowbacteria bacterium]|nr:hypothetical protein [Candidatus Falkowbacteria bacterium]
MSDQIKVKQFFILLGDVAIMYSSLYLTILARHLELPDKTMWASHASFFTINFIFWIIFLYIGNLYNLHNAVNNARFFERVTNSIATSAIFSLGFFYLSPQN